MAFTNRTSWKYIYRSDAVIIMIYATAHTLAGWMNYCSPLIVTAFFSTSAISHCLHCLRQSSLVPGATEIMNVYHQAIALPHTMQTLHTTITTSYINQVVSVPVRFIAPTSIPPQDLHTSCTPWYADLQGREIFVRAVVLFIVALPT